jgi:hypothetical protein
MGEYDKFRFILIESEKTKRPAMPPWQLEKWAENEEERTRMTKEFGKKTGHFF